MNISCPNCNFSKTVDSNKLPNRTVKATCPRCNTGFSFDPSQSAESKAEDKSADALPKHITCPACGLLQVESESCAGCGVNYKRFQQARQEETGQPVQHSVASRSNLAEQQPGTVVLSALQQPKAGFWIRVVACLLDFFLLFVVQLVLSLLIGLVISLLGVAAEDDPAVNVVIGLFIMSISLGYAVFFTGYCGQTPGKMALRIKVIRTNGSPIGYGRAALREILGKFVSKILLCVGYLMVAFDSQKQGLHDKIADSYVVKL